MASRARAGEVGQVELLAMGHLCIVVVVGLRGRALPLPVAMEPGTCRRTLSSSSPSRSGPRQCCWVRRREGRRVPRMREHLTAAATACRATC
jgi:hypothetical protein